MKRANPDVQIEAGGEAYTLRFSVKALAALQDYWELPSLDAVGQKLNQLDSGDISVSDYTAILWAALRTHHPEATMEQSLDIFDELGIDGLTSVIVDAMSASSSEDGGKASSDPRKRGQSTG